MKKLNYKKHFGIIALVAISILYVFSFKQVSSNATQNFVGWAWEADNWSDLDKNGTQNSWVDLNGNLKQDPGESSVEITDKLGGVGWISFNCTNNGTCANNDYGVDIDVATGDMVGYAWSSNYGWLKFGGLADFPKGTGNIESNAKIDPKTGSVTGWARFCSAALNPVTCLGTAIPDDNKKGGWDGWVSLKGTVIPGGGAPNQGNNYGLSFTTADGSFGTPGQLTGWAWGGNDSGRNSVGWIKFTNVNYLSAPSVTISANPKYVPTGGSTVISWLGENLLTSPTGCQTSGSSNTGADWYGTNGQGTSKASPLGAFTTGVLADGVYNYSIQCLGSDGVTLSNVATAKVIVGAASSLNFFADPATVYPPDFTTTLKWQALNSDDPLTNCVAESAPPLNAAPVVGWDGPVDDAPVAPQITWQSPIHADYNPTNFKLTCKDVAGNSITSQISVIRGSLLESLTLKATEVVLGPTSEYTSDFSWSAVNMETGSCVATDGGPNWPGQKSGPPGEQIGVIVPVTAPDYTIYRLTCTGKYSGEQYIAEIQMNEGSGGTFSTVRPKYTEN